MGGMRIVGGTPGSQSGSPERRSRQSILEIDSWMPSQIQAISPLVDRLMLLIERSYCIPDEEPDVELALREALANAVVHGNRKEGERKVHIRCRCGPGKEISIVVQIKVKDSISETSLATASRRTLLANMDTVSG